MRRKLYSFAAGLLVSNTLATLETVRASGRGLRVFLQFPGFIVAALIWGVHSAANGFAAVMIIANAYAYGLLFSGLARLTRLLD